VGEGVVEIFWSTKFFRTPRLYNLVQNEFKDALPFKDQCSVFFCFVIY